MSYTAPEWSITGVNGRLEAAFGTLMSRAEDTVTIVCSGPSATTATAGTAVSVSCGTWTWVGEVKFSQKVGSGDESRIVHQCRGLYYKLGQYTYFQLRKCMDSSTGTIAMANSAYVTLFQSDLGVNMSADDQIAEAVAQTGITLAECTTGLILPQCDEAGITVRGVIEKVLSLAPKVACWFDSLGRLHIAPGAAVSLANLISYRIGLRGDLGVRGVTIEVYGVASATVEGVERAMVTRAVQSAGATTGPGICYIPIQTQALKRTWHIVPPQKVEIITENIPASLTGALTWWKSHVRDLEGVNAEDIEIHSASAVETESGAPLSLTTYPRLALTPIPDSIGKASVKATFKAVASFPVYDSNGNLIRNEIKSDISFDAVATDATTRGYTVVPGYVESEESSEFIPDGVAASLFAAWNELFGEGEVTFHAKNLPSVPVGGKITAAGISGYIQSIQFDSRTNICTATVAPPDQSGLQSMVKLQTAMKRIISAPVTSSSTRDSGDPQDGTVVEQDLSLKVPMGGSGSTRSTCSVERQDDGSASPSAIVVRDVADITDEATLRYRKVPYVAAGTEAGTLRAMEAWMLASEPVDTGEAGGSTTPGTFPPTGWEERADSIVDIQWDSSYHKIQVKWGTILVKTGTVTEWEDLRTFGAFNV